jgi:phosphate-selective porin OprO/OprP
MTLRSWPRMLGPVAGSFAALALLAGAGFGQEKKDTPVSTFLQGLRLSGYVQVYGAVWNKEGTDTFLIHRARVSLAGEIVKDLRFKLTVDLARSQPLLDAEVEFAPVRIAGVRAGQFLVPFSLENDTSSSDLDFIDRTAVVDELAPGRDNGSAGRDIGAVVFGGTPWLEYAAGIFNGSGIDKADTDGHKDFSGRVVLKPFRFLAVGGSFYRGRQTVTPGAPLVARNKEGLEAAVAVSRFSAKGEYIHARDDAVSRSGWYAQAGCFALPAKLQAVVRYQTLDLDRAIPDNGTNVTTLGLNWTIRGKTKLQVNYEIHGLEGRGRAKSGLLAQLQAAF